MPGRFIIRHGVMRFLGEFDAGDDVACGRGDEVIVRSERGLEVGEVLCETSPRALAWIAEPTHGQIVRRLTEDDQRVRKEGYDIEWMMQAAGLVQAAPVSDIAAAKPDQPEHA